MSDDLSYSSFRQARDEYCENITSDASPELENLIKETLQHPWEQAHADGKIQYMVRPGMMSGHHEGNDYRYMNLSKMLCLSNIAI